MLLPTAIANTFIGNSAGAGITGGSGNTYIGNQAGQANTTGSGNVYIGNNAGVGASGDGITVKL